MGESRGEWIILWQDNSTVKQEKPSAATQWPINSSWQLVSAATDMQTTKKELLETVSSFGSDLRLYNKHELENLVKFTSHDLCDKNHEWWVKTRVQALLTSADDTLLGKVRPCDIHKLVSSLKLRKTCGLDGIPNKCLRHLPRRSLVHLTHSLNHTFSCPILQSLGRKQKL
jgi:hypothetical protein